MLFVRWAVRISQNLLFLVVAMTMCLNAQTPTVDSRSEPFTAAWQTAKTEAERLAVEAKFGPIDLPLLSVISSGGENLQKKGDFPAARIHFNVCAESAIRVSNDLYASICLQLLGGLDRLEGKYDDAEQHYRQALDFAQKPTASRRIPFVLNNLAGVYIAQAQYPEGLEMLQATIDYNAKAGIINDAAPVQNMGSVYGLMGDSARAIPYFLRAQTMYEAKGDDRKLALVHYNIGVLYSRQADYGSASREFDAGRALAEKTGDTTSLAMIYGDVGRMRGLENKPAEAITALNRALELSKGIGFKAAYNDALLNIGNFEVDRGDLAKSKAHFEEALQVAEQLKDAQNQGLALRGLGLVARRQKDYRAVLGYAEDGVKRATQIGDRNGQWQSEALAGIAWRGLGDNAKARETFQRAVTVIEEQRGVVAGGEVEKQLFFEQAAFPYQELALIEADAGNTIGALQAAERTRARVLLDILEAGPSPIDRLMSDQDRAEEKHLRAAIAAANSHAAAIRERDQAWHAYESFLANLYSKNPELRTWRGDSPVVAEKDLEALVPDASTAIVEFLSGQDQTLVFTLTRVAGKLRVKTTSLPVGREALTALAGRYRSQLEGRDPGFRASSRELYDQLLKPVAADLRIPNRVYIVADGPLWELPFQSLPGPSGGYWIEHAAISMTPSITFLRDENALAQSKQPTFAHALVAYSGVPELDEQVRKIGTLYSPGRTILRTGGESRESTFKTDALNARVLHLAAHGVVDRQNALHSRIVLSSPESNSQSEDGWLEAWELMRMNLNADLAILSACETGRGRVAEGEGMVGLTWAMFVAGVRTTVVSQWQVEARSTTQLMIGLHERLRHGDKPAEALRGAILALMKNPRYSHPMYWSAFVVTGL